MLPRVQAQQYAQQPEREQPQIAAAGDRQGIAEKLQRGDLVLGKAVAGINQVLRTVEAGQVQVAVQRVLGKADLAAVVVEAQVPQRVQLVPLHGEAAGAIAGDLPPRGGLDHGLGLPGLFDELTEALVGQQLVVQPVAAHGVAPAQYLPQQARVLPGDLRHAEEGDLHALVVQHVQEVEDPGRHPHAGLPAVVALQVVQVVPLLQVHGQEGAVHPAGPRAALRRFRGRRLALRLRPLHHAVGAQHAEHRAQYAAGVEGQAHAPHILAVQAGLHVDGQLVPPVDLGPAGQPGAQVVGAVPVPLGDQVELVPQRRARAHHRHLALEDVEQLGQLVQAVAAQKATHGRDVRLRVLEQMGGLVLGCVGAHGAELVDHEVGLAPPHPLLPEEHRPRRAGLHRDGQADQKRRKHRDRQQRKQGVQAPLDTRIHE